MQSDLERVLVLMLTLIYVPDGLYLPPFCGACCFFFDGYHIFSPPSILTILDFSWEWRVI
jgi:hypothetical protein